MFIGDLLLKLNVTDNVIGIGIAILYCDFNKNSSET